MVKCGKRCGRGKEILRHVVAEDVVVADVEPDTGGGDSLVESAISANQFF